MENPTRIPLDQHTLHAIIGSFRPGCVYLRASGWVNKDWVDSRHATTHDPRPPHAIQRRLGSCLVLVWFALGSVWMIGSLGVAALWAYLWVG